MISVAQEGELQPSSYNEQEFEKLMKITYLSHIEFQNEKTHAAITKLYTKAERKKQIDPKQKWLGAYYAQELLHPCIPNVTIKWISKKIGYGLFTNVPLKENTFIGEYVGVLRKKWWFGRLKNLYCFDYTVVLGKNTRYVIDAEKKGNYTRFINHSETGNVTAASALSNGMLHIILYANQQIPADTQLCYDYGDKYWAHRKEPSFLK